MFWRLILVGFLTLLVSCASTPKGDSEAELAAGLAGQQRYRDAIAAMDQAILKEPKNGAYKATRSTYVDYYTAAVKKKIATVLNGKPGKSALDLAEQLIEDALAAGVEQSELAASSGKLSASREQLYAQLQREYDSGTKAMDAQQWVDAYRSLTAVAELYPNYEDTTQRLSRIREQASRAYLAQAGQALKADDLNEARAAVNNVLAIAPQNSIARKMLGRIDERDNKAYFMGKVAESQAAGDDVAAEKYCNAVLTYDSDDASCRQILADLGEAKAVLLAKQARLAASQGRLFDAADYYFELHQYESEAAQSSRASLKRSLVQLLGNAAREATEDRQRGLAWAIYQKLAEVDPMYAGLGDARRRLEDRIRNRTRKSIAVFDFNSPTDNPDAGVIVANNLIARLFNNAGRDIKILERENLKSILEEMKLGQIGVVSEDTAKEMGRIHGIDYAIMGSVLLYKVDTRETESSKTVRYQIGDKIEDNIDYLNWLAVNPRPSKSELEAAPMAKIKVPKWAVTEYDVVEIKKVGFLSLSFRIVDVATGENTRVHTIERKKEVKDTGSEGLVDAGVTYDPTEVPTDTELLQALTDDVIDNMSVDVLRPLQSLEKQYFDKGEAHEKRNELLPALENYVDGIFNERIKSVGASPLTDESLKRIDRIMHEHSFET